MERSEQAIYVEPNIEPFDRTQGRLFEPRRCDM
jgi:hypothetical protein